MSAPIVSWWTADNLTQKTSHSFGTIDAGTQSAEIGLLIWNNRGGNTVVSDMTNCSITTKDGSGGNTGPCVTEKWMEVKCLSKTVPDAVFIPVGGETVHPVQAAGQTENVIKGIINDGTTGNSGSNFTNLIFRLNIPVTAGAGNYSGLFRMEYSYT